MPNLGLNAAWGAESWASYVLEHLSHESVLLRSGVRRIVFAGRKAHLPRTLSDGNVSWVAELQEIPSSAPTADEIVLEPRKIANLVTLSNEAISDAPVNELDAVGNALTRSVATAVDARAFGTAVATATEPAGLRSLALPSQAGGVLIEPIIRAVGKIEAAGGVADSVYIAPADLTSIRVAMLRGGYPISDPTAPGSERIAGAQMYSTPALPTGTAIVAQADQILVGIRQDAEVSFSDHARFSSDGIAARVVARVDFAVNDVDGLAVVVTP